MKQANEWLNEVGETVMLSAFAGAKPPGIEVETLIKRIQDDARKDGLMTAQGIASSVIQREAPKYAAREQRIPAHMTLSGLAFFVTSAITSEADKLDYAPQSPNGDLSDRARRGGRA